LYRYTRVKTKQRSSMNAQAVSNTLIAVGKLKAMYAAMPPSG
jgi:hypothetical protein